MNNYYLKVRLNGSFYMQALLKADFRKEAIEQANEIMNRFPEPEYKAEIIEENNKGNREIFSWFN